MLCRKKNEGSSGELYAMKTLRKAALVKRNQLLHTKTERNILQNIQHPFLVNLKFAFQTPDKLYMGEIAEKLHPNRKKVEMKPRTGDRLIELFKSTSETEIEDVFNGSILKLKSVHD